MAERRNKDKEIQTLQAEVDALRRQKSLFPSFSLSGREKLYLAAVLTVMVLSVSLLFVLTAVRITTPERLDEEGWNAFLSLVEGREWQVSSSTAAALRSLLPFPFSKMRTERRGNELCAVFFSGDANLEISFSLREGRATGFFSSRPMVLVYSESAVGTARALTLTTGDVKIVFAEEK